MSRTVVGMVACQTSLRMANPLDLTTPKDNLTRKAQVDFQSGGEENQINRVWHDQRTLGSGSHDNLGLVSSLTDAFGGTIQFASVKYIKVRVADTNSGGVIVGNSVSARFASPFSLGVHVPRGGWYQACNPTSGGWVVTSGTNSTLRISNDGVASGSSNVYEIEIGGYAAS